jgi:peptidoglycan/xylan/chitin deacetylase (PgdA/CDA1 family)/GT2 family glycosyltransferase
MSASAVAVVITCFELGRTLEEAVDSVLNQTLAPDEVVVVDDGSRDSLTNQALARVGERGVTVIRTDHRGPAHARNVGVESTASPFVVLLDADDLFEPTYLERAVSVLAERPELSFVCCALRAFGRASYHWKPPPYSLAEAVGRGACGHISTVFRREIWDAVGGFDAAFSRGEDIDFWLRALELGFRGLILDEALLRYRVRRASRYHSAVVQGEYLRAKALLIDKHLAAIAPHGEDVFVTLLDFQRELSGHARMLVAAQQELSAEIVRLEGEIGDARVAVREHDGNPFDWGDLDQRPAEPDGEETSAIEAYYLDRFLDKVATVSRGKRRLTIRPGDGWPDEGLGLAVIAVAGALDWEDDPRAALGRCRNALRPGGVLLVAATSMTLNRGKGFGFTEASLRALLSDALAPATVDVTTYGNLSACLAAVARLPPAALDEEELQRVDPRHPVLVVASGRLAHKRGTRRSRPSEQRLTKAPTNKSGDRGVVLLYHRIASLEPDTHRLCVPPDGFERQMTFVAETCAPLPLRELVSRAAAGRLPPRAVAVTFDDGYLDNLKVASPVLERLGIPATFFVNGARREDGERETWWDSAERILCGDEPLPDRLRLGVNGSALDLPTASPEQRRRALSAVHGRLIAADGRQRDGFIDELCAWSGLDLPVRSTHRLLTSSEIVRLGDRLGHEIGAHGANHLLLTAHDDEVRRRELDDNRALLEDLLGRPVQALAYPYGDCDLRTTSIAEQLGFAVACSVDPDPVTSDSDPLRLPRFEVSPDIDGFEFRLERLLAGH